MLQLDFPLLGKFENVFNRHPVFPFELLDKIESLCDLVLTLVYVSLGGEERNPIMALFLEESEGAFIAVKFSITVLGALFLLMHVRFRHVRTALVGLVAAYVLLIIYHIWLLKQGVGG